MHSSSHARTLLRLLSAGTTPGQDLNLSMDRVVSTHAFVNKLWNAGKFILMNLESLSDGSREWTALETCSYSRPESWAGLALTERWVLSALHEVRTTQTQTSSPGRIDEIIQCFRGGSLELSPLRVH